MYDWNLIKFLSWQQKLKVSNILVTRWVPKYKSRYLHNLMHYVNSSLELERQNGFAFANHDNSTKLPFLESFILGELDIRYNNM